MNNQILNHLLMKSKYMTAIILTSFLISGCYKSSPQQTNTPISTETTINPSTTPLDRFASATNQPTPTKTQQSTLMIPTILPTPTSDPVAQPPQSGAILFTVSAGNPDRGIFILSFPEMKAFDVIAGRGAGHINQHPTWSPDGEWVAYSSDHAHVIGYFDLYLVRSDGTDWHRLTYGEMSREPDWSPDGKWIAFVLKDEIALIQPDGTNTTILTSSGGHKYLPTWSPNGKYLAFLYYPITSDTEDSELWVMDIQTQKSYQVTTGAIGISKNLSWTPDGQKIYFGSYQERDCNKLFMVENRENGKVEEVSLPPDQIGGITWSPDQRWISFVASQRSDCNKGSLLFSGGKLYIAKPDMSKIIEIPGMTEKDVVQPEWKPEK